MKILILSGSPIIGGGELVARRLAKSLTHAGCSVIYVSIRPETIADPAVHQYVIDAGPIYRRILNSLRYISYPLSYRLNTKFAIKAIGEIIRKEKPDIINIHIIKQAFWSPDLVDFCAENAPTIWTLHEMSSFTGRCVHALSCTKYIEGCDETCPNIHIPLIIPRSLTRQRWLHQKNILENHPSLVAVCPSKWLADRARESLWAGHRIEVIPNGVDIQEFIPDPRDSAREQLGLPSEIKLILVAAVDLASPLKGGAILREALQQVRSSSFGVVTMGGGKLFSDQNLDVPVFNLGFVPPSMTRVVYSAVDFLVHPSQAESFGMVIIEANACGVPVIAFANTALQEVIQEGINGWLVQERTSQALAENIDSMLQRIPDKNIFQSSREYARQYYAIELQAEKYRKLSSDLINLPLGDKEEQSLT